jgi:hypothetical protein
VNFDHHGRFPSSFDYPPTIPENQRRVKLPDIIKKAARVDEPFNSDTNSLKVAPGRGKKKEKVG